MLRTARRLEILLACILAAASAACDWPYGLDSSYPRPPDTGDGWDTASLEDVGMDPTPLLELRALIDSTSDLFIHSALIARRGKLVFEEYWPGTDLEPVTLAPVERPFDRETLHYVASVSKSVTSALMGIALDQGLIESVQDSLFVYFPEYDDLRTEANGQITLAHLLGFSSGYDWNEHVYGFDDPRDSHYQMFTASDPVAYLLGRPVTTVPGTTFRYNSGDTNLTGEIVHRVAGMTLSEFADRYLFQPLDIDTYTWRMLDPARDVAFASAGLSLRPRDMAKLGALYLNDGTWHEERVVSAAWVEASTTLATWLPEAWTANGYGYGYGYNWWLGRSQLGTDTVEYFRALGWGGQDVVAFPALDLVVVFTAGAYYEERPFGIGQLIERYVLPAIVE
jgi:CubicO group peptidase (beta-lactamase class C family)